MDVQGQEMKFPQVRGGFSAATLTEPTEGPILSLLQAENLAEVQ